jgi:hypothetical protein
MKAKTEKYFNFPIQLLMGFMYESDRVLLDILRYSIYENSLKLYIGNEEEKMMESAAFFNVTVGNISLCLDEGRRIYNDLPRNSPKVGLNLSIFWNFYRNDKTEFDKICLLGFLAIKSILGPKAYFKLTNKTWLSRMSGYSKAVDLDELPSAIKEYNNEYQLKKIKTSLINNWGLVSYSRYTRGFYVSYSMNQRELITIVEKNRLSIKEKQRKADEKQIVKEVLERLNNRKS